MDFPSLPEWQTGILGTAGFPSPLCLHLSSSDKKIMTFVR